MSDNALRQLSTPRASQRANSRLSRGFLAGNNHESMRIREIEKMKLTSTAFENGAHIPEQYTGVGEDLSPQLAWTAAPEGTQSFALICDDPDAPSRQQPRPEGPWVHWVIYNIPATVQGLAEGLLRQPELQQPEGALQGKNDFGDADHVGYRGPMPPVGSGPHRYYFKLYAVDRRLELPAGEATKDTLLAALHGHVLGEAELMGHFERK
jgi:Raf kinase inhibitor-like YbhB/YbcL family protein